MKNEKLLKSVEKAVFILRDLYTKYGYLPFKMSKVEEYDLYAENKQFLIGDSVITFNDTDGRLLALKPDVTLSIIKNTASDRGSKRKVYYNENVYRVSQKTHRFKEIMQSGIECIGDIDTLDIYESVELSCKSLMLLGEDFILDISHLGILSAVISAACDSDNFRRDVTRLISEKNKHEIEVLSKEWGVGEENTAKILSLVDMRGKPEEVLEKLKPICASVGADKQYDELSCLVDLISESDFSDRVRIDFSVVNDMNYYNGIVFKGFLNGISEGVLSGGQYGLLMKRMGKNAGAVGFAIYLDLLEEIYVPTREYDVDLLLIYSDSTDAKTVLRKKAEAIKEGKSVFATKIAPDKFRYKEIIKLD